jgi:hypothetical protein
VRPAIVLEFQYNLVGGLEHLDYFSILEMSSSQLTFILLVSTSEQAIIQQMQSMFTSMQANLEKTLQQNLARDADKRPRVDGPGSRADPFANKS